MQIDVRARNEDGDILFEGKLNRNEVSFLLGYAVRELLHAGVVFNLQPQENGDDDDAPNRLTVSSGTTLN